MEELFGKSTTKKMEFENAVPSSNQLQNSDAAWDFHQA